MDRSEYEQPSFKDLEEIKDFISAAFREGDPGKMLDGIGAIARAHGISELSRATGRRRENLYKALSSAGNPGFKDVVRILQVLGFELRAEPIRQRRPESRHSDLIPAILELQAEGATSLRELARGLTQRGIPTSRGLRAWTPTQVSRVLSRMAGPSERPGGRDGDAT